MYTKEQLMPKRYPENRPSVNGTYWCRNLEFKYWIDYLSNDSCFWGVNDDVRWFIDIPGAPDECKPLAYPENKPERIGLYIAHLVERNECIVIYWGNDWGWYKDEHIDYFIPIRLDAPDKEDDVSDKERVRGITVTDMIAYLEKRGYTVTKPEPEIAPCPFCGGECGDRWHPFAGFWMSCTECRYNGGVANTKAEAIRLHNGISGRV